MEGVDGNRFHDAGPAVAKDDGGKMGAAVEGEERAGVQKPPCVIVVRVPWIRLESKVLGSITTKPSIYKPVHLYRCYMICYNGRVVIYYMMLQVR